MSFEIPQVLTYNLTPSQFCEFKYEQIRLRTCKHQGPCKWTRLAKRSHIVLIGVDELFHYRVPDMQHNNITSRSYNFVKQRRLFQAPQDAIQLDQLFFQCGQYFFRWDVFHRYLGFLEGSTSCWVGRLRSELIHKHCEKLRSKLMNYEMNPQLHINFKDGEIRQAVENFMPRIETFTKIEFFMFDNVVAPHYENSIIIGQRFPVCGFSNDYTFENSQNLSGRYHKIVREEEKSDGKFERFNTEDSDSSDDDSDIKSEAKIERFEQCELLKGTSTKFPVTTCLTVQNYGIIIKVSFSPYGSEGHTDLVPELAEVVYDFVKQALREGRDPFCRTIVLTTDGLLKNVGLCEKVVEYLRQADRFDLTNRQLNKLESILKYAADMFHRARVVRSTNDYLRRCDYESHIAFRDRQHVLRRFELQTHLPVCDDKWDIETCLALPVNRQYFTPNVMTIWSKYIANEMKLRYTQSVGTIEQIQAELRQNRDKYQWCRDGLKYLLENIHELHSTYLLAVLKGMTKQTTKGSLYVMKNNTQTLIRAPDRQVPPSIVQYFLKKLNVSKTKFDVSCLGNSCYQSLEEGKEAIESLFETYSKECYQVLKEKKDNHPLYNNIKINNLLRTETRWEIVQVYWNNRKSKNITHFGTKQNEMINSYFNKAGLGIGRKGLYTGYMHAMKITLAWNLRRFRYLRNHKQEIRERNTHIPTISDELYKQMEEFEESLLKLVPIQQLMRNRGYIYIDGSSNKIQVEQQIDRLILGDKIQIKGQPEWNSKMDAHLRHFLCLKDQSWIFDEKCKDELTQYFYNLFSFKYLVTKARHIGWRYHYSDKETQNNMS